MMLHQIIKRMFFIFNLRVGALCPQEVMSEYIEWPLRGRKPGEHLWVSVYKVSFSKDGTTWSFYSENGVVKVTEISMNEFIFAKFVKICIAKTFSIK